MHHNPDLISVVIPFYKGNRYISELLSNLEQVNAALIPCNARLEVIIVNDSPDVPVEYTAPETLDVILVENPRNMGIHATRIHGISHAKGQWIQMLDQDDLLIAENYPQQLAACRDADVAVGNCYYFYGQDKQLLYSNGTVMNYLIAEDRFLNIRNLIASPGHCLIRKEALPAYWLENPMTLNGSDDYFLWMLLFHSGVRIALNEKPVYVHRNSEEGNLSFNYEKMHSSNLEMCALLKNAPHYPAAKLEKLQRSICFKFLYDTGKLKPFDWLRYADKVWANGIYKITTGLKARIH